MLSIVTLGVYAAWAKVRTRQYFYANTRLGGHAFEYHGNPISILKGNLVIGLLVNTRPGLARLCGVSIPDPSEPAFHGQQFLIPEYSLSLSRHGR
jgi:hypothetical protein